MLAFALAVLMLPSGPTPALHPSEANVGSATRTPAPDAEVRAVDTFGRPVDGLELDLLVRAKDGSLADVRCAVGADGRAQVSKVRGALVHASAAADGDWHVVDETWWLDDDDVHGLLTVVPRVPVEVRLRDADGVAVEVFAAEFDMLEAAGSGNGYFVGANGITSGGVTTDGVLRLRVPRGCDTLELFVPGSFGFWGVLPIPSGMFAGSTTIMEQRISSNGLTVLEPRAPRFTPRTVRWTTDGEPVVGARWTPCDVGLWNDPSFREQMGGGTDEDGHMTILEPLDDDGDVDRYLESSLRIARAGDPDGAFVFSLPPVPEPGFDAELATEVLELAMPDAPKGFEWSFVAAENAGVQRRLSGPRAALGHEGRRQVWAPPNDGSVAHGVLHLDAWLWGPYDRDVAFEESRGRFDLSGLPGTAWYVEAYGVAVEEDLAYADCYHVVPIDRRGRARALAPIGPESAVLHARAPGWCGGALPVARTDDGFEPVVDGELIEIRFVDAAGDPAPFVHFAIRWHDTFIGAEPARGWSDGAGRAIAMRVPNDEGTFCVQLAPTEMLPGTVIPLEPDEDGVATIVVPERGRLAIDGVAIAGGEPRHLKVRVAAGSEKDGAGDPDDRRDSFGTLDTASDGSLVIDGVPKGTYRVWASDVDLTFDGDAPSAVVSVD